MNNIPINGVQLWTAVEGIRQRNMSSIACYYIFSRIT